MMEQWIVIGISGVTCSGKTTLAQTLYDHLKSLTRQELKAGLELNRVELINQDSYFRELNDPNHQIIEKLNHFNWEVIESIDMDKMINDVMRILGTNFHLYKTRSCSLASNSLNENIFYHHYMEYSNNQHMRAVSGSDELFLTLDDRCKFKKLVKHNSLLNILIIEGFLIFNHPVTYDLCNIKFHLHVQYEVCYSRRIKRTYDPPDVPCYFEMVVWPLYEKHLQEFKDREEVTFLNGDAPPDKCFHFVLKSLMDEI
ncbi:CLUMA_CG021281, isoform A [Clunio marinus]|uniref:CLUMA_CG021281, isoform A n=1 Tax=Clunio marinus TaxID=568069 RepID=A0A1J1JCC2_9DIPT|nr:CLUMA_CG021281, isoform A [Clunio marinus]